MELREKETLYFQKDGKFEKLCDCARAAEVDEEVIKVELSEENIIAHSKEELWWLIKSKMAFPD